VIAGSGPEGTRIIAGRMRSVPDAGHPLWQRAGQPVQAGRSSVGRGGAAMISQRMRA